jgi:protein-L-isoaspartate(D-aspartate) O-methyltransferase
VDPALSAKLRAEMVERQLRGRGIHDERVLAAMATLPRERFVPPGVLSHADSDDALPIASGQSISQPYMVARMTELLEPRPDMRVLEVGTGSGYQAAVLA